MFCGDANVGDALFVVAASVPDGMVEQRLYSLSAQ
jgi:hypothetical protein